MKLPRISIVTPSYEQGQFIEETIDSVLSQGYDHLEYIIIDGGSQDKTVEIIKKYEKHLSYWVSEPDKGQSHAINKGLSRCTGEIFNWLNSDDYYEPDSFAHIAGVFDREKCDIYCGKSRIFDSTGILFTSRGTDIYPDRLDKTIGRARIDQPESFWRTDILKGIGGINDDLHYLMDRDIWIKYLFANGQEKVFQDDKILVNFRHHDDSKTVSDRSKFKRERNDYFLAMTKKYGFSELLDKSLIDHEPAREIDLPENWSTELVGRSLNEFLTLLAEEAYSDRNMRTYLQLIKKADKMLWDEPTVKSHKKLRTKARMSSWILGK